MHLVRKRGVAQLQPTGRYSTAATAKVPLPETTNKWAPVVKTNKWTLHAKANTNPTPATSTLTPANKWALPNAQPSSRQPLPTQSSSEQHRQPLSGQSSFGQSSLGPSSPENRSEPAARGANKWALPSTTQPMARQHPSRSPPNVFNRNPLSMPNPPRLFEDLTPSPNPKFQQSAPTGRREPTPLDRDTPPPHMVTESQRVVRAFNVRDNGRNQRPSSFQNSMQTQTQSPSNWQIPLRRTPNQWQNNPSQMQNPSKWKTEYQKQNQNQTTNADSTSIPTSYDSSLIDADVADAPVEIQQDDSGMRKRSLRERSPYKERGSLLSGVDAPVPLGYTKHQMEIQQREAKERQEKERELQRRKAKAFKAKQIRKDVYIPELVTVGTLSRLLGIKLEDMLQKMYEAGMREEMSYDYVLTSDYAVLLAEEFGRNPVVNDEAAFDLYPPSPHPNPLSLQPRPPIVTIMGHVDHGKTTLLDTLRSASVAKGEAGGITQHIGAFSVPVTSSDDANRTITFLDTPGHAAFSAMRARGANITDIIVLVIAADDGLMPQTLEIIKLLRSPLLRDRVSLLIAINKIDKPGANADKIHKALMVQEIQTEEFGGDVPSVEVSGLTGKGMGDLVDNLSAMAEMADLRAERDGNAFGSIIESKVMKGLGSVATVLVLKGCLKPGAHILCGTHAAKVRLMTDSAGKTVSAAYPGMAVTVSGFKTLPPAGEEVIQASETDVKRALANRVRQAAADLELEDVQIINANRKVEREKRVAELELSDEEQAQLRKEEGYFKRPDESDGKKELRLIVKGDVSGSVEAVNGALEGIGNHLAVSKVIHSGVGDVSEQDIAMAKNIGGMVIAFSVNIPRAMRVLAEKSEVDLYESKIIYQLMDEVRERVIKLLPVTVETAVTGEATILQTFDITLKGRKTKRVAGSRVINGLLEKNKKVRIVRAGETVYDGTFEQMRIIKKDVTEIRKGTECGLSMSDFDDLQEGDLIQVYTRTEKPGLL